MKIFEKLQTINTLKNKVDKLMPQKDWDHAFLEKVKVEFTYNTNKIEGNTITYGQSHYYDYIFLSHIISFLPGWT